MELKLVKALKGGFRGEVLIVPLWNWNLVTVIITVYLFCVLIVPLWNWNPVPCSSSPITCTSLNRTFMELKPVSAKFLGTGALVLIVPLWNWNKHIYFEVSDGMGLNRTFMELKLRNWTAQVLQVLSLNRTFMELKPLRHSQRNSRSSSLNRTFMELKQTTQHGIEETTRS